MIFFTLLLYKVEVKRRRVMDKAIEKLTDRLLDLEPRAGTWIIGCGDPAAARAGRGADVSMRFYPDAMKRPSGKGQHNQRGRYGQA